MNEDNEVDLYELARLFDAALASNNRSVKKALRNFMLVASIVEAEEISAGPGPLASILSRISTLEKEVITINQAARYKDYNDGQYFNGIGRWDVGNLPVGSNVGTAKYKIPTNSTVYGNFDDLLNTKGK